MVAMRADETMAGNTQAGSGDRGQCRKKGRMGGRQTQDNVIQVRIIHA